METLHLRVRFNVLPGVLLAVLPSTAFAQQTEQSILTGCVGTVCFEETTVSEPAKTELPPEPEPSEITFTVETTTSITDESPAAREPEEGSEPELKPEVPKEVEEEVTQSAPLPAESDGTQQSSESSAKQGNTATASQAPAQPQKAAAPGMFEVDEVAAVRALERSLTQIDALLMSVGTYELGMDFSFGFNVSQSPIFLEVEDEDGNVSQALGSASTERRSTFSVLEFRAGLPLDSQISVSLPHVIDTDVDKLRLNGSVVDVATDSVVGVGDLSVSLSKGLISESGYKPDIIASLTYNADTGSTHNGVDVGSGAEEYTAGISFTKRQDPLVFTGSLSRTISSESDGFKAGDSTNLSLSTLLGASPFTSISFSFSQAFFSDFSLDGQAVAGTGGTSGSYAFGVSSVIGRDNFLSASLSKGLSNDSYLFSLGFSRRFDWQ